MRRIVLAALVVCLAPASAAAQLAVTSRLEIENIGRERRIYVGDLLTHFLMGQNTRQSKLVLDVKTFVGPDAVRIEGMGPVLGLPDHVVLLVRDNGTQVWLDSVARTFVELPDIGDVGVSALGLEAAVKSSPDGSARLLGRETAKVKTEIKIDVPNPPGYDPDGALIGDSPRWVQELVHMSNRPFASGTAPAGPGDPLTGWESKTRILRDRKIVVQTWTSPDFGADGMRAAVFAVSSKLRKHFSLAPSGLPLKEIVLATSSNGFGQRYQTTVVSTSTHTLAADQFAVPAGYTAGSLSQYLSGMLFAR